MTTIEFILLFYFVFSGIVEAAFCYDKEEGWWNVITFIFDFLIGWIGFPIIIGIVLSKISLMKE